MKQKTIEYALRSTWQLITTMYNEKAMKYDATMTMAFTLLSIDAEGTPSTALGPKMGMESTSLSRLLNTMEERGYIERKPNPEDGRGVLIFLTQQGKEKRDFLFSIMIFKSFMSSPAAALSSIINRIYRVSSLGVKSDSMDENISVLNDCKSLLEQIIENDSDSKYNRFRDQLKELKWTYELQHGRRKDSRKY